MYCYRFPDEATFMTSCEALGWTSEGVVTTHTHDRAIDEIDSILTLPGTYDEDGVELTPPTYDTRYHVNFQGEPPKEWGAYLVMAITPSRTWQGLSGSNPS